MSRFVLTTESLSDQLRSACLLECAARKPGNVHPSAAFADACFVDFVRSADVIGPVLSQARDLGIGQSILQAVTATKQVVGSNTNLGMILLLAPLAAIQMSQSLSSGIGEVLSALDRNDAVLVYTAIRLAQPGGLGTVRHQDIQQEPDISLVAAMSLVAEHDLVARQYSNHFHEVLKTGYEWFLSAAAERNHWELAILDTQLQLMAVFPDSLIQRKCGRAIAEESQRFAQEILESGGSRDFNTPELQAFDRWLREDGHRRNPGTTADLIAAILFAVIREGTWKPPGEIEVAEFL